LFHNSTSPNALSYTTRKRVASARTSRSVNYEFEHIVHAQVLQMAAPTVLRSFPYPKPDVRLWRLQEKLNWC
jgi:hypothetical protein